MSRLQLITRLLGLQGWEVARVAIRTKRREVIVTIRRAAGTGYQCRGCNQLFFACYDQLPGRLVRDFPVWGRRCYLKFTPVRVSCPKCGVGIEKLDWVAPFQHQTLRYERYIAALCSILPVLDVAESEGLNKGTVYRIDRKYLELRFAARQERSVRFLGIDEIAIRKGQHYATLFYDLERREVIDVQRGRRQRQVSRFFRRRGRAFCRGIVAVCMDLWKAYFKSVTRHCRQAVIVFDKFHVYCYLSEAVDSVRRFEQAPARKRGRDLIKGSRWLWLKGSDRLRRRERETLRDIMATNENLTKAYLLKEDFEQLYESSDEIAARCFLSEWTARCVESGLMPFCKLARRLLRWAEGILAYFKHRISNGVAEGINHKIKVMKRRSYGFRDLDYFFLKIMGCAGNLPSLESLLPQ